MFARRMGAARRTYIAITALVVLASLTIYWVFLKHEYEEMLEDKKLVLMEVAAEVERSFDTQWLYEQANKVNALPISQDEKALLMNKLVQPKLMQVSQKYPNMGMGVYWKDIERVVAIAPSFDPKMLVKAVRPEYTQIYQTGRPTLTRINDSLGFNGKPVLNMTYPIVLQGKMIGHTWASAKTEDIEHTMKMALAKVAFGAFLLLAILLLIIRAVFARFNNGLIQLVEQIKGHNHSPATLADFPELIPVLKIVGEFEQKEQEKLLALERFKKVFSSSLTIMSILRANDMTYIDVNEAWERIWGFTREEAIGKTPSDLGLTEYQAIGEQLALSPNATETRPFEYIGHTKFGEKRIVFSQGTLMEEPERQILYVTLDITQNKQYEQEIAHLDRLNIVGEMAAGIGHEVRNPMTTVRGYIQLLQQKEKFHEYQSQFNTMLEELDRANAIITEFLSLAKDKTLVMKPDNLNKIISALIPLMQADAFRRGINLHMELGVIPLFEFDENEIRQLILNLVKNGFEAMEGGEIIIRTYSNRSNVILEIQDAGPGIPDEVMKKLGTPFVTTKENGTGLGLPVCYRIANRHGARIDVETGAKGTTFIVTFNA